MIILQAGNGLKGTDLIHVNHIKFGKYTSRLKMGLTVMVRDGYTPHGTRWQCTAKIFFMTLCYITYVLIVPKKFDLWSEKCRFRSFFGSFPVHFKNFLEHFYRTKRFVFEFQGESLESFLSQRAQFRRYQHLRGFWQSTVSSYRDC